MDPIRSTLDELARHAGEHAACLVAYSGGKDSVIALDLCSRAFKRVVCFHLFLVPGLEIIEAQCRWAKERYGVEVLQYPSIQIFEAMGNGRFVNDSRQFDDLVGIKISEVYDWVRQDTGISLIATGMKKSDSMARRRFFANTAGWKNMVHPIMDWTKFDVMGYGHQRRLQFPDAAKGMTTGVSLVARSLFWLHDEHPEDWQKLLKWFPYAEAIIYRRKYYGF